MRCAVCELFAMQCAARGLVAMQCAARGLVAMQCDARGALRCTDCDAQIGYMCAVGAQARGLVAMQCGALRCTGCDARAMTMLESYSKEPEALKRVFGRWAYYNIQIYYNTNKGK